MDAKSGQGQGRKINRRGGKNVADCAGGPQALRWKPRSGCGNWPPKKADLDLCLAPAAPKEAASIRLGQVMDELPKYSPDLGFSVATVRENREMTGIIFTALNIPRNSPGPARADTFFIPADG